MVHTNEVKNYIHKSRSKKEKAKASEKEEEN